MDPIGFALENFDWMGRWRTEENGLPVDASASMPSGEHMSGPVELRQVLLAHKEEYLRNLTTKMLGFALGRSLGDADQCAVQRIVDRVKADQYRGRTLIREIVMSVPFRSASIARREKAKYSVTSYVPGGSTPAPTLHVSGLPKTSPT